MKLARRRPTARELTAIVVAALMSIFALQYCYLIIADKVQPVLATWLLFLSASSLTLWAHSRAGAGRDRIVSLANVVDVMVVIVIVICLVMFGEGVRFGFTAFEYTCLAVVAAVAATTFGWRPLRHNPKAASMAFNAMLAVGYFPMLATLWTAERNTEPFGVWLTVWLAAAIALYNPIKSRDFLAGLYSSRAFALISIVLLLMVRLKLRAL